MLDKLGMVQQNMMSCLTWYNCHCHNPQRTKSPNQEGSHNLKITVNWLAPTWIYTCGSDINLAPCGFHDVQNESMLPSDIESKQGTFN
jgi:hypothetical protein